MTTRMLLCAVSTLSLLAGCGKEMGRVPFSGEGLGQATVSLKAGDVDFWTDLSIEYQGDPSLEYHVELLQGGTAVGGAICNPLGQIPVKMSWTETNIGSSHSRSGTGKMTCSIKLAKEGPTTVKATLTYGRKPSSGRIKKADLIVKQ